MNKSDFLNLNFLAQGIFSWIGLITVAILSGYNPYSPTYLVSGVLFDMWFVVFSVSLTVPELSIFS